MRRLEIADAFTLFNFEGHGVFGGDKLVAYIVYHLFVGVIATVTDEQNVVGIRGVVVKVRFSVRSVRAEYQNIHRLRYILGKIVNEVISRGTEV